MSRYCFNCMRELTEDSERCPECGRNTAVEVPPHHLRPGTVLQGRYQIGTALGQGGFGITYIGRDLLLNMRVAVKEFYPTGYANRNHDAADTITVTASDQTIYHDGKTRFLREAKTLARFFEEDSIVSVLDYFEANNTVYIVMEYLEGVTLKQTLQKWERIPADQLLTLMHPLIVSLEKVHRQGIIHRDISPDNIMLLPDGRLKLLDFGAAREIGGDKSLSVMLKPGFAPEEQYRSRGRQGPWTDVYALCATMYNCLTGRRPEESVERAMEPDSRLTPPTQLGAVLTQVQECALLRGMAVYAEDRYQSMSELERGLYGETAGGEEQPYAPGPTAERAGDKAAELDPDVEERTAAPAQHIPPDTAAPDQEATLRAPEADTPDPEVTVAGPTPAAAGRKAGNVGVSDAGVPTAHGRGGRNRLPILAGVLLLAAVLGFGAVRLLDGRTDTPEPPQEAETVETVQPQNDEESAKQPQESEQPEMLSPEERAYTEAEQLIAEGKAGAAALAFHRLGEYADAPERCREAWRTAIGHRQMAEPLWPGMQTVFVVYLLPDGTVIRTDGREVEYADIVEVSGGSFNAFYLHADGSVTAEGLYTRINNLEVSDWRDIVSISACDYTLIGLQNDGTVVTAGSYANINWTDECDDWTDIVQVAAGTYHVLGLKADGTVVSAGKNSKGQGNVSDWENIIYIAAGTEYSVGVRSDGSCVITGSIEKTDFTERVVWWSDVVRVYTSESEISLYGLRADGTWLYCGVKEYGIIDDIPGLIEICPDSVGHKYALKADGTLITIE